MEITFTLTGEHASMMAALYNLIGSADRGPRFRDPSELARSLLEALLEDDMRDNGPGSPPLPH